MYFEVKISKLVESKYQKPIYIVKAQDLISAYATASKEFKSFEDLEFLAIVKKDYVEVFEDSSKAHYYEVKIEWDNVDGKTIKETYLQQAYSTKEAETKVNEFNGNNIEVTNVSKKNYVEYLKEEV